ncbi:MAG: DNA polymerase III subunit beta [Agathobacter sp.]
MEFKVKTKDFLYALSVGGAMAGKNKTIPILDCVKCEIRNGILKVTSFNGEVGVSAKVALESADDGIVPFCFTFSDIVSFVKAVKDETVTVSVDTDSSTYTVSHGRGKATFAILNSDDFPSVSSLEVFKKLEEKVTFMADGKNLSEVLSQAMGFVNNDQLRFALNGVYLVVKEGMVKVFASDSHRLYSNVILATNVSGYGSIIVPPMAVASVVKSMDGDFSVDVCFDERNIGFKGNDCVVSSPLIVGRYPNVESVIPKEHTMGFTFDVGTVSDSLSRVMVASNAASQHVRLSFSVLGGLEMNAEDLGFNKAASENVMIEDVEGECVIGFKGTLLASCLKTVGTERCKMEGTDGKKAVVFREVGNDCDDKIILLMPVMVS